LAAGQGSRMRSSLPKVLHPLGGRPLLLHVLETGAAIAEGKPVVVVGAEQPAVRSALDGRAEIVEQLQPLGTGDAVRSVPGALRRSGPVLVLSADVPLIRAETLRQLLETHASGEAACTLLSVVPDDPSGMGRVQRDIEGHVGRILEEGDMPRGMVPPIECNAGVYVFEGDQLWPALDRLSADNAQAEYYLTDIVELMDGRVSAVTAADPSETIGINDRRHLAAAEAVLRRRLLDELMAAGVTIEDPATTFIDAGVRIGADSVISPMTTIGRGSSLGSGCRIGPMAELRAVRAGDRVSIGSAHLEDCVLGDDVSVGPYCRVRPNTVLASGVELGTHAEVKNSTVGSSTRINHFSCVLDSDVGKDVNIGAGTVTCNFDGGEKHRTTIGDRVFVGSNTTIVAPVRIGDRAYIGAGSLVNADVPAGALAVGRARQRNIEGWAARRRSPRG
ncbi:MAG: bifunctional UDP-N-acetylglucosamine diphosphorylase/glucosamine-1-phosphate N-acetyltransferase GlmU, partial [Candidatus Dormibacteraeota bacterium]|nr:bifunctional UDP-N-acetylglucosamine diphosphorylase/glucosamine-1-phosphate N-acetyltransferase GlmU [Candidatus Dormibacteraeota bacterium]